MRTVVLTATPQNQGGKPRIAPMRKPPNPLYFLPVATLPWVGPEEDEAAAAAAANTQLITEHSAHRHKHSKRMCTRWESHRAEYKDRSSKK